MTEPADFEFDFALSFAGEDRELVARVADDLRLAGIRVFYDRDQMVESWGEDLNEYFGDAFRTRARFAVLFVSANYAAKAWPTVERRAAQARSVEQLGSYILPVRLDDTELDGLLPTVGFMDMRVLGAAGIADMLKQKHALATGTMAELPSLDEVPRSEEAISRLLLERPSCWEYLLFAAYLRAELASREEKYHDHLIGYASGAVQHVGTDDAFPFLRAKFGEAELIVGDIETVFSQQSQVAAFGAPGEPGNPELIRHIAKRAIGIYERLLDWAAALRSVSVAEDFRPAFRSASRFTDDAIEQFRKFVVATVAELDTLPARLRARTDEDEPLRIDMPLTVSIDPGILEQFNTEMREAAEKNDFEWYVDEND